MKILPLELKRAQLADAAAIAKVHVSSWKTTYHGIIDEVYLSLLSVANREKQWEKILTGSNEFHSCWVAEQNECVVGFASAGKSREALSAFDAELYAIYLLEDSARQGTGSLLFKRVLSDCIQNGFLSMIVWVAEKNPSRRFYENLGGKLLPLRKADKFGESEIVEVAYGWRDLSLLV